MAAALRTRRAKVCDCIRIVFPTPCSLGFACADDVDGYLRMASMCATVGKHARAVGKLRIGLERYPVPACCFQGHKKVFNSNSSRSFELVLVPGGAEIDPVRRFPGHEELTNVLKELEAQALQAKEEQAEDLNIRSGDGVATEQSHVATVGATRMSQSFEELLARGRDLFRNLPREEREHVYDTLSGSQSLLSKMIRDACAVTVQCAVRSRQVRSEKSGCRSGVRCLTDRCELNVRPGNNGEHCIQRAKTVLA